MVSKDEWDTKDTGKSMKNALYEQWYGKSTSQVEVMSNSKRNQPHSLSHCRVMQV